HAAPIRVWVKVWVPNQLFPQSLEGTEEKALTWRRGWDSNPRYPCGYSGFRDRYIQPLCHLSRNLVLLSTTGGFGSGRPAGLTCLRKVSLRRNSASAVVETGTLAPI